MTLAVIRHGRQRKNLPLESLGRAIFSLDQHRPKVIGVKTQQITDISEREEPVRSFVLDPFQGVLIMATTRTVPRAAVFIQTFDGVLKDRYHQPFFPLE